MITENLSTLKIHKLTQEQYDRELEAGNIDSSAIYLTPDEDIDIYVQNDEPTEAEEGALWLDVDAEGDNEPQIYIDDSLSITGQAADAKAVGDALATKQPIGNYATENYVTTKIAEAELSGSDVDLSGYATKDDIPTKTSELTNDSSFITASGAPVQSVNGKTGTVNLVASDIGALPNTTVIPTVPTNVSAFTNDAGYLTEHQSLEDYAKTADLGVLATKDSIDESYLSASIQEILGLADTALQSYTETDPTVPTWAKASTKPTYTKSEVGLGNVDNVKQYSASNPPPYPVTSVNGMTGDVEGAVLYTEQTLTEAQKAQVRENIGAIILEEVLESLYDVEEVAF